MAVRKGETLAAMAEASPAARAAIRTAAGKIPPTAPEAEIAVLSALVLGVHVDEIRDIVRPAMLADPTRRTAYRILEPLAASGQPIDVLQARAAARAAGAGDAVEGAISEARGQASLSASAPWYAGALRRAWARRAMIDEGSRLMQAAYDDAALASDADISGLAARTAETLSELGDAPAEGAGQTAGDLLDGWFTQTEARARAASTVTGIPTGYPDLDRLTSGWQASDLIILAARPAMGKTALALNLALNAASAGRRVAVFSLEMSAQQLEGRLLSIISGVPLTRTRRPTLLDDADMAALYAAGARLQALPITIDDRAGATVQQVRAACRKVKPDIVFIDYLQLMHGSMRSYYSREAEVGEVSRSLKGLAKELAVPVVALAQLNRQLEARDDKRPILADLRESGSIEQDADLIMFLHRQDVYVRRTDGLRRQDSPAELIVGKARSGPCGTVRLLCRTACTAFESVRLDWHPDAAA